MNDKVEKRQASVEVTPEMVEAGVNEIIGFDPEVDGVVETVTAIYQAMVLVAQT